MDSYFSLDEDIPRCQKVFPLIRIVLGLKSNELANLLDISRSYVTELESGYWPMSVVMALAFYTAFNGVARKTRNVVAMSMLDLLIEPSHKVSNEDIDICIERCTNARLEVPKRYGIKKVQEKICTEYERWMKEWTMKQFSM